MSVFSRLCSQVIFNNISTNLVIIKNINSSVAATRQISHGPRQFPLKPSRWQWYKCKDFFHYYTSVGLIPVVGVIILANVFIGPATLTEVPKEYTPKHWEYYRNPITRLIARYVVPNPQQEYEKLMHVLYEENERKLLRQLEKEIRTKMAERHDYQSYYYRPVLAKYHRASKQAADYLDSLRGD